MSIALVSGSFECEICDEDPGKGVFVQTSCCRQKDENGQEIPKLHFFHQKCLKQWVLQKRAFECFFCKTKHNPQDVIKNQNKRKFQVIVITEFFTEQAGHAALMLLTASLSKKIMLLLGEKKVSDAVKMAITGYVCYAARQIVGVDEGVKIQIAKVLSLILSALSTRSYLLGNIFTKTDNPPVLTLIPAHLIGFSVGMIGNKILLKIISNLFKQVKIKVVS